MRAAGLDGIVDRYYADSYNVVVHSGAGGAVQNMFHRAIERPYGPQVRFGSVLELGATSGEHLAFVSHHFERYTLLDIRDSDAARQAAEMATAETGAEVSFRVGDATDLAGIDNNSVDRLIAMCLLHHLDDPLQALRSWRRVVRPGGTLSIFVPCDPGMFWRVGRALTTFPAARRRGYSRLEVRYINACEHRNHVASLRWMLEGVFADDRVRRVGWPFPVGGWNANLFNTYQITVCNDT